MVHRFAFLLAWILLASSGSAEERTVTLVGDRWCPFNCKGLPDENRGLLVERAADALAEEGIGVAYDELPWSRAIIEVRNGNYDAIVGTGLSETPDFYFPPEPLAIARHSFYTLPSSSWKYQGLESLQAIRIGVIQDYSYGGLYDSYIKENRNEDNQIVILRGDEVLPRLIKMLELGRIDALVAEERVLNYHFRSKGERNRLRYAGLANKEELYVGFSPELEDGAELAEALGRGLVKAAFGIE
ncbi:MAG: transporter substrate-binding domain-containing protein [Pseudomonadota bacterium]|jgi:polar amino acid transport system substrate-binding protein|nr:transporter substrate-binding domain-containing protein [Pseudomonadota bacterium]